MNQLCDSGAINNNNKKFMQVLLYKNQKSLINKAVG